MSIDWYVHFIIHYVVVAVTQHKFSIFLYCANCTIVCVNSKASHITICLSNRKQNKIWHNRHRPFSDLLAYNSTFVYIIALLINISDFLEICAINFIRSKAWIISLLVKIHTQSIMQCISSRNGKGSEAEQDTHV